MIRAGRNTCQPFVLGAALLLAVTAVFPGVAGAATLQVPGQYRTIQEGVNAARPGDVVQVAAGTYNEKLYLIGRSGLTIAGAGSGATRVTGRYNPSSDVPAVYVERSTGIRIVGVGFAGGHTGLVVTGGSSVELASSSLTGFHNVGAFVGEIPCSPLPPGSLKVPACYLDDRRRWVDDSRLDVRDSVVADNGVWGTTGTGLVYFPGTSGTVISSDLDRNQLTGIFVWGATVDLADCRLRANVEHALEFRQYPHPKMTTGFLLRASGSLTGSVVRESKPLPGRVLGGGMVTQAADLDLVGNTFADNRAWGLSASNRSRLTLAGNTFSGNGRAGVIVQRGSTATLDGDALTANRHEGLVVQGRSSVEVSSAEVSGNRRFGVLLQKRSQGRFTGGVVEGNGTADGYYGGMAFAGGSWGSVASSTVTGHANGPGIHFYGGTGELTVADNEVGGNRRSGVVFDGTDARGDVSGNTFARGNAPYDVACPGGGNPSLFGQGDCALDARCLQ